MAQYLLGTDNGGTVAKAALFTTDRREAAVAGRKAELTSPAPGHTERDMETLWQATAASIREVIEKSGARPEEIACVAPAGHGNGLYLIDERGRPVRPGIYSTDSRAKDYVARWMEEGVHERVLPLSMQSLWPGQPNALLAWLKDHEPESIRRARWVLMCKDYIRYRLSGEVHAELTDASGTSLLSVRDGGYDPELLGEFGLADLREKLPPLVRSEEICGRVTREAAAETGLAEGTPVAGGLFDADACCLAAGLVEESQLCIVAGTWSVNQYISPTPVVSRDVFMTSRYCIPDHFLMMEASATSASNLEWFVAQFLETGEPPAAGSDESVYERCNRWVAETGPEDANVVFLPFLFGSNADPEAKASLVGLAGWHGRGHVLRAIYEGVVFGHKAHVDRLMQFRAKPESIQLTGGAARSEVWTQIFADVFQTPVEVPAGTELGALGAAIAAAVAVGCYPDYRTAVAAMVEVDRRQTPDPARAAIYAQKYERYRKLLAALGPLWQDLG